jgi:tripartite-type tricarboxylate transporter receptor subunit TctC
MHLRALSKIVLLAMLAMAGSAWAQTYPTKPIRIIVAFAPGGPADVMARLIAQRIPQILGQSLIIENKPGAGGTIGARAAAESGRWLHTAAWQHQYVGDLRWST